MELKLINENQGNVTIPEMGSWHKSEHIFEEDSIWAINAALSAERALLIRGEPGVGKSQLARAAAHVLGRVFLSEVVHARSECQDLLWNFDAVARLGEAQALVACTDQQEVQEKLATLKFLSPRAMWWAFNWTSAQQQSQQCTHHKWQPQAPENWQEANGSVLLIDEIDKADVDLPNGLLETLGNGAFTVPYLKEPVKLKKGVAPPLVVITTNEERELPYAFLRRCMVLHMQLPQEKDKLVDWLIERGKVHFPQCDMEVRAEAAEQLWKDRRDAKKQNLPAPGQAEYLDILRALNKMSKDKDKQLKALHKIQKFALKKHFEESIE